MKYNPKIHSRRSIRLKGYDYSQDGMYFITICCQNRICRFGKIKNGKMMLNDFGKIAHDEWIKLPKRFSNMFLNVFQIMPNHIHGIIVLETNVGATLAVASNTLVVPNTPPTHGALVAQNDNMVVCDNRAGVQNGNGAGASPAPTNVGAIIGAYKSSVANKCLEICKTHDIYMGKLWQRNYWEHIIRNEQSQQRIKNYIVNNPSKWDNDKFYLKQK